MVPRAFPICNSGTCASMGHWFRRQRSMDARDGEDAYRRRYAKKEPGPKTGPGGSVCRRGGRHHLPEGNMLMRSATLGGQRRRISVAGICSGDSDAATDTSACQPCTAGSVAGHLARKSHGARVWALAHVQSGASKLLKVPALRVRNEKIAEDLDACDRFQLFRIDEIGIERERIDVTE